jgi:endonuclease YncB( thermonuclease family)
MKMDKLHDGLDCEPPLVCTRPGGLGDDIVPVSNVLRVIDGDSFVCNIARWPKLLGHKITIRVRDLWCPEMRSADPDRFRRATQAKRALEKLILGRRDVVLYRPKRGKYFRIVADVAVGNVNLREFMSLHGHNEREKTNGRGNKKTSES